MCDIRSERDKEICCASFFMVRTEVKQTVLCVHTKKRIRIRVRGGLIVNSSFALFRLKHFFRRSFSLLYSSAFCPIGEELSSFLAFFISRHIFSPRDVGGKGQNYTISLCSDNALCYFKPHNAPGIPNFRKLYLLHAVAHHVHLA